MNDVAIFSIGYERRELEPLLNLLQQEQIQFVIDVRSVVFERQQPEFAQESLSTAVSQAGMRYVYMGNLLGDRPDIDECYDENGRIDYTAVAQMGFFQTGISRLQKAYEQGQRVVLLSQPAAPQQSHRSLLIGLALADLNVPVIHIDEHGRHLPQGSLTQPPPPKPKLQTLTATDPLKVLKDTFGYDSFRPLQQAVVDSVLAKQDTLAIMPKGSGKSLCYQLQALMFEGLTVVVSPLIALMEDQVMQLQELGVPAAFLNSTLDPIQQGYIENQVRSGQIKLLYAAPETLLRPQTVALLESCPVDCFTIDEAHCISEWGHDFRPEYQQLAGLRSHLPNAVCVAVTATATERVQEEIKQSLAIPDAGAFIASFNRENLFLAVEPKQNGLQQIADFLQEQEGSAGIVYCSTRKNTEIVANYLESMGYPALAYHAGMADETRRLHQRRFVYEEGLIMVATVAFGMGINKSNVRFVIHYDLPKNLEGYYQQIGRAGRDGLRADCLLLFSYSDVQTINYFIQQEDDFQQRGSRQRLEAMLSFAETNICRRQPLLDYFGEPYEEENCEWCDNCTRSQQDLVDLTVPAQKFLSCIKRTGESFGMTHIIDVLRGSKAQKIVQRGHDKLSTYNIGTEYSKKAWQMLGRQFLQMGLIAQNEYGGLVLTEQAYAIFKGDTVTGVAPEKETAVATGRRDAKALAEYDRDLFEILRQKRSELAAVNGVPPYVIFSDRSLVAMASSFPQSKVSFGKLYGVGTVKLEKYADQFLPLIQAYCAENELEEQEVEKPAAVTSSASKVSGRTAEVLAQFNSGRSVPELMALYQVKQSTILGHLEKAIQADQPLRSEDFASLSELPPEAIEQVEVAFDLHGTVALRPIFEAFGEQVSYDELRLLRLHYLTMRGDERLA
ncbi:MAG: DNA helicase RecQ [Anaerolineales bacterium]|nr:DNA helicase RecQ [Anaerolineales bacterium]